MPFVAASCSASDSFFVFRPASLYHLARRSYFVVRRFPRKVETQLTQLGFAGDGTRPAATVARRAERRRFSLIAFLFRRSVIVTIQSSVAGSWHKPLAARPAMVPLSQDARTFPSAIRRFRRSNSPSASTSQITNPLFHLLTLAYAGNIPHKAPLEKQATSA